MTSITRQISRRIARRNGVPYKINPQPTVMTPDGGYRTLRPTKGWLKVSGKRLKGQ